jgi:hypothetical protein
MVARWRRRCRYSEPVAQGGGGVGQGERRLGGALILGRQREGGSPESAARYRTSWVELPVCKGPKGWSQGQSWKGRRGAPGRGGARGGGVLTGRGPEESGTGACVTEEEDGGARVVVAILYGGRWLGDVHQSKALCERMGMPASVLEAGQHHARRCSSGVCGEAVVVMSRGSAE